MRGEKEGKEKVKIGDMISKKETRKKLGYWRTCNKIVDDDTLP